MTYGIHLKTSIIQKGGYQYEYWKQNFKILRNKYADIT